MMERTARLNRSAGSTRWTAALTILLLTSSPLIAQDPAHPVHGDLDGSGRSRFLIEAHDGTEHEDPYVVRVTRLTPEPVVVDEYGTECSSSPSIGLARLLNSKAYQIVVSCPVGNRGLSWTWILQWRSNHLVALNADALVEASVEDLDGDGIDEVLELAQPSENEEDWEPLNPHYKLYRLTKGTDVLRPLATIPLIARFNWRAGQEESDVQPFTAKPGRYKLIVRNGPTAARVGNVVIMVNGVKVAGAKALEKKPRTIARHVTLRHSNQLRVVVKTPTACAMNIVLVSE
jgi:hypothetical protein